ncbi:unnamed protein product [Polarella glacialis]|uniref:Uncharacterized protein n=1 Tax=Polarella glacialis TaxID=89957 RepID=A0A813HTQ5_POLGL|nr:unnamed protein product [Polarella glacialis]|mmetsp:Transcript_85659/g.154216  ORF Transcript_85659/g.154216 Transcript_85659/m.154216 type:complete len:157 (+) Transcript_85659:53-523(+)
MALGAWARGVRLVRAWPLAACGNEASSSSAAACLSVASRLGRVRGCGTTVSASVDAPVLQWAVSDEEIASRDSNVGDTRAAYEQRKAAEVSLGPPFGRKVYVSNLRQKDGRTRVPKLTITDSSGAKWMTLSEADFEEIVKLMPKIKDEIIRYQKKL